MTSFIGSILINQLLLASLSRRDMPENKRRIFCLFCDEFQNFATPSMNTLLVEARKYRVASHLFHQTRQQEGISDSIRSTTMGAGSLVVFRVNPDDAKELSPAFSLIPPTEIIERPVRAPAQNVIETLINRGSHEDPRVNEFVQKYLRPLSQATNDKIEYRRDIISKYHENEIFPRKDYPEGSYAYNPRLIKEELNILNTSLFTIMTSGKTFKPDYVRQWSVFAQYLGCSHFMYHKDVKNYRTWDTMMTLNLINELLDTNKKSPSEAILDLMGQLKASLYYKDWDKYEEEGFPFELTYFYTNLPFTTDINDLYHAARIIDAAERKRMEAYWTSFEAVSNGLKKSPILIDSGKIEYIQQAAGTYADKANAVANELTQLPRFHAKVKIPSGEYVIFNSAPQGDFKSLAAKKQQIIGNTKRLYCKSRSEIEEEIRRRQEMGEPPMTTTRKHPV